MLNFSEIVHFINETQGCMEARERTTITRQMKYRNNYKVNQVYVMDNTSCPKKVQDRKGKRRVNCSETYQDQAIGSLIEKDEAKRSKRMRSTNEEGQVKSSGTLEKEEDHSFLSKITTERPQKKRRHLQWTSVLDKKLDEVVRELGENKKLDEVVRELGEKAMMAGAGMYLD
ncbi:hypothetical protein H5410_049678 [Solanum commersonii]|uniref:Uncharacterized protein n=1 Tax=Solanum commersonii TaxID=4109 RepID=A0A9J5WT42_SOLCO|nr:hypothetical protein H5410_049678 [Solanum commersonii]